jgi:hypothetical protein
MLRDKKNVRPRMSTLGDSKVTLYSCRHCGAEYIAYPPDDVHSEYDVNELLIVSVFLITA